MKLKTNAFILAIVTLAAACADTGEWPVEDAVDAKSRSVSKLDVELAQCMGRLDPYATAEMIELSDPETLYDEYDAQKRVNRVAQLFREAEDPRGLFATVYRLITNRAVQSVDEGA